MDFTIKIYNSLLETLQECDYSFLTFKDFLEVKSEKAIVLRHDVDLLPENSLRFAQIQEKKGIKDCI